MYGYAQTELETLLTWLDPARKPLLVQLPEQYINGWSIAGCCRN